MIEDLVGWSVLCLRNMLKEYAAYIKKKIAKDLNFPQFSIRLEVEKPATRIISQSRFNLYLMQNTVANLTISFISLPLWLLAKQSIKLKLLLLVLKLLYRKIFFITIYWAEITIFKTRNSHSLYSNITFSKFLTEDLHRDLRSHWLLSDYTSYRP